MEWTLSQIQSFAPDASSLSAGEKIAREGWKTTGQTNHALWGEITGSGSKPYQVRIDLREFAYRCTCPSRKLPCKHVLGLLLKALQEPDSIPFQLEPDWITEWLTQRDQRAEKKKEPPAQKESAPSPQKRSDQNKRAAQRMERVKGGMDQLTLWLNDFIRSGLAGADGKPQSFWTEESKWLVDAQAPGVNGLLQRASEIPGSCPEWPELLLGEFGKIALLLEAFSKLDTFSPEFQSEIRQQIGWTLNQADLEASGEKITDCWIMCGQSLETAGTIQVQRNWYRGCESRRFLLYLQFAAGKRPFDEVHLPGTFNAGEAVFWPGTSRIRGKFLSRESTAPIPFPKEAARSFSGFLTDIAQRTAANPWTHVHPALIGDVFVRPDSEKKGKWILRDPEGKILPIAGDDHWDFCSLSASRPITLFGEWKDQKFYPLSGWYAGRLRLSVRSREGNHA
ncbi:MAG: SWIM zinc finger family protein [Planctomycetia bacterium]|nr:SWIM zinc finger family protein [Planctomycetia bacterium]